MPDWFREGVLKKLDSWARANPAQPVMGSADTGEALSRHDVYVHVREHTELGEQLLEGWREAALEHVMEAVIEDGSEGPPV